MSEILADVRQFYDIEGQLRQSQQNLLQLEAMIRASPALAREFGYEIAAERQAHNALVDKFNWAWGLTFGTVPQGLQGPVLVAVGVVAVLAYIAAEIVFRFREQNRIAAEMSARQSEAQAAILAEQNRAALEKAAEVKEQQAAAAEARGDTESARQYLQQAAQIRQQAGTPGAGARPPEGQTISNLENFVRDNWPWLVLAGAGGVFLVSRL
jgi:hypothetical protein